ncbi:hypothetical protein ACFC01_18000 [Streptomyces mirabilis]|uniref:hypothetical protein n=1 Tax=Streptomyces mirabilis TaxID=68239 RepID=UPI0035DE70F3
MPDRSGQPLQQPTPRTDAETLAAQILTHAADRLDTIPTTAGMTDGRREQAVLAATTTVLGPVTSKWVRTHARAAALAALPPVSGSTADYAAALREIAGVAA